VKKSKLEEGGFIFLRGKQVLAKYKVAKIEDGKAHFQFVNPQWNVPKGKEKGFVYEGLEFDVGKPMFKKGLPAYPFNMLNQKHWEMYYAKMEIRNLMAKNNKLLKRTANLINPDKVLKMITVTNKYHQTMRDVMRSRDVKI
jgi:hypothetical protein